MKNSRIIQSLPLLLALLGTMHGGAASAAPKSKASAQTPASSLVPPLPPLPVEPLPATPPTAPPAAAVPAAADDVVLYGGAAAADEGITLSAWGGGDVQDSADVSLSKGHALKITTMDLYQGGTLTFQKPVDLDTLRADKTRTLTFALRPAAVTRHFTLPSPSTPRRPGRMRFGMVPDTIPSESSASPFLHLASLQGGQRGRGRRRPYPTTPQQYPNGYPPNGYPPNGRSPYPQQPQATSTVTPPRFVHLVLTFAGGKQMDILRPYPTPPDGDPDQWLTMGVPLAALGQAVTGPLQSITLAGDDYGVLYVGQIEIVRDIVPLTCFAGGEQTVSAGDPVTLSATAGGGASALVYTWDFDASDGITEQATGKTVTTGAFLDHKKYTVTLTVSDVDGLKQPVTSTTTVTVR